ncbi:MAG: hypothetical protein WCN81_12245, partial [Actinomycetes bacterium]
NEGGAPISATNYVAGSTTAIYSVPNPGALVASIRITTAGFHGMYSTATAPALVLTAACVTSIPLRLYGGKSTYSDDSVPFVVLLTAPQSSAPTISVQGGTLGTVTWADTAWSLPITPLTGQGEVVVTVPASSVAAAATLRIPCASATIVLSMQNTGRHYGTGVAVRATLTAPVPLRGLTVDSINCLKCSLVLTPVKKLDATTASVWTIELTPTTELDDVVLTVSADGVHHPTETTVTVSVDPARLTWKRVQTGVFEVYSSTLDAAVGLDAAGGTLVLSPTTSAGVATFSAPSYAYGISVTTCISRKQDAALSSSVPLHGSATLSVSTTADDVSLDHTQLVFNDGADQCFAWTRTAWATGAHLCGATDSTTFTIGMVRTSLEGDCTSASCPEVAFFSDGVTSIVYKSTIPDAPVVSLLPMSALQMFGPDSPPPLGGSLYLTHAPKALLLAFERRCMPNTVKLSNSNQEALWDAATTLEVSTLFGTNAGYFEFAQVTAALAGRELLSFSSLVPDSRSTTLELSWKGGRCGEANIEYVWVGWSSALQPGRLAISLATAASSVPACAAMTAFEEPGVSLHFINDPLVVAPAPSLDVATAHRGVYMCDALTHDAETDALSGCIGVIAESAAAVPAAGHELITITLGEATLQPGSGGMLEFDPAVLASMCTTVPRNYAVAVTGKAAPSSSDVYSAMFGGDWPDSATLHNPTGAYRWSPAQPYYPTSAPGDNPIFDTAWSVQ